MAVLIIGLILTAGCTGTEEAKLPVPTIDEEITPEKTTIPTEEPYEVTEPVLIIGDDIYSTKITVNAKDSGNNALIVSVNYDSTNQMGTTGTGSDLRATVFAYNYRDVEKSFNPKTRQDVIDAGIPYRTVGTTLYPNNKKTVGAELPTESLQGSLTLDKPYNYGAIIEKQGERN
ncbi:hypothetical protein [Methanochimaera problematica]|nr:hypothetical protein [Methanoplanus sp. FWC-SCC4]